MTARVLPSQDPKFIRPLAMLFKVPAWMISDLRISTPGFPCPCGRAWRKGNR